MKIQSVIKYVIVSSSLLLVIANFIDFTISVQYNIFLALWMVIVSFYLAFTVRKNILLFIVVLFIAYSNYSIFIGRYLNPEIADINKYLVNTRIDFIGINILILFVTILLAAVPIKRITEINVKSTFFRFPKSNFMQLIILVILPVIWLTSFNLVSSGKATYTPLYEYSIIFFIFGYLYSRNNLSKTILSLFLIFYVVMDFYGGSRVTGIQLIIIFLLFNFSKYLNARNIVIFMFFGLIIANILSVYRGDYSLSIQDLSLGISKLFNEGLAFDTSYFAYFASLTFIGTIDYYSVVERLGHFMNFFISQFYPGEFGESLYQISRRHFFHSNGGVLPIYMYYYLGAVGSVMISFVVVMYMKILNNYLKVKFLYIVMGVYFVVTVPRWYLYSPYQLLRGMLLIIIVYSFFELFRKYIIKK